MGLKIKFKSCQEIILYIWSMLFVDETHSEQLQWNVKIRFKKKKKKKRGKTFGTRNIWYYKLICHWVHIFRSNNTWKCKRDCICKSIDVIHTHDISHMSSHVVQYNEIVCCWLYIYIYIYIYISLVSRVFGNGQGNQSLIPGLVIPKTQKMALDATFLNT